MCAPNSKNFYFWTSTSKQSEITGLGSKGGALSTMAGKLALAGCSRTGGGEIRTAGLLLLLRILSAKPSSI